MRLLTLADVPSACELSAAAGWNQLPADWERIIALEPLGCFCIEEDERVVATTTLLTYDRDLAWVGMVLTHAEYQRRGFARQLVTAALELALARGMRSIKLDATDEGRPLYASLGFEDEQPVERWSRDPAPVPPTYAHPGPLPFDLDWEATGVDRSAFLNSFGEPVATANAYALQRPGARANYVGPCISRNAAEASQLLRAVIAGSPEEPWFWDLLPANRAAQNIAEQFGFRPVRRLTRMVRGERLRGNESMIYAIAGFEAG
jgi:GNAT superfamily N-acetyltransferase